MKHIGRVPQNFELGDAFEFGKAKGLEVHEGIEGRYCGEPYDWGVLAQMIFWAGGGDHLEIGTLFGGSTVLAALTQIEFGLAGQIVCIDPLDSYYGNPIDLQSNTDVTYEAFRRNTDLFGVTDRIAAIRTQSKPWPLLPGRRFATAFIDGAHDFLNVQMDWVNCSLCTEKAILFDNYDQRHDLSIGRVVKGAISDPDWTLLHASGISVIVAKPEYIWPDRRG